VTAGRVEPLSPRCPERHLTGPRHPASL
jgi:hypothetical protein